MNAPHEPNQHHVHLRITIDGRSLTVDGHQHRAAELLRLAGLDPANFDLALHRKGEAGLKRFDDDDTVHVKDGDTFVTIRQQAPVA